ncbi:MAG: GTPase [Leptolyngbyaceae cyanobacterium RU_5_1]|nr:GTPase [Leptolyngbyaceae cyanobacterium RU_5_1]
MDILRLVVTGTPGAGKTTFVRSISDIGVVDTDRRATDETSELKPSTTVAFDYGHVAVASAFQLHVYGTPGQSRFNFMWDILIRRAHAYILLVAANRPQDFSKATDIIAYMDSRVNIPMVIGITHLDRLQACTSEEVMAGLGYTARNRPMSIGVNANNPDSVNHALNLSLLSLLLSQRQNCPTPLTPTRSAPAATGKPPLQVPKPAPKPAPKPMPKPTPAGTSTDHRYFRW